MRILKRGKIKRKPSSPGEILRDIFLLENNLSQADLAQKLVDVSKSPTKLSTMKTKLSELINGKRSLSAHFAVLLSMALNTDPRMWLNLQTNLDLWNAEKELEEAS